MTEAEILKHKTEMNAAWAEFAALWARQNVLDIPMQSRVRVEQLCWLFFIHAKSNPAAYSTPYQVEQLCWLFFIHAKGLKT